MAEAAEKPGFFQAIVRFFERLIAFFGEVRVEMGKVIWPTKEQVKSYTITVIVATVIICTLIGAWDAVLGFLADKVFNLSGR